MEALSTAQKLAAVGFIQETGANRSSGIVQLNGKNYLSKTKTIYKSGFFSDLSNGEALRSSDLPKNGVRSMKGNMTDEGTLQLYLAVRILIDTTAVAANVADAGSKDAFLASAAFKSEAPGYVKNSTFEVVQGTPLCDIQIDECKNDKIATRNQDDFCNLDPFYIRPKTAMNYVFTLPEGVTPVATHAYKIQIQALELTEVGHA